MSVPTPSFDLDNDGILDEFDNENIIDSSTTLSTSHIVVADVTVQDGALLTIPNGLTLSIALGNNITIHSGSGILIESGGVVQINS